MRYIDADVLKHCIEIEVGLNPNQDGFLYDDVVNEIIDQQPTADVAPVVHGKWVVEEDSAYIDAHCSECGIQVRYNHFQQFDCFCRRCGAKMDL